MKLKWKKNTNIFNEKDLKNLLRFDNCEIVFSMVLPLTGSIRNMAKVSEICTAVQNSII
jgi:phosphoenolpyruvate carboxylase